jgi:hypothetical protein
MKAYKAKLVLIMAVFVCMSITALDPYQNPIVSHSIPKEVVGNIQEETEIEEIFVENDPSIQEPEAAVNRGSYNIHPINQEEFSVNPFTAGTWNRTGDADITYSAALGGYITIATSESTAKNGILSYQTVLSPGIRRARLQVDWAVTLPGPVGDDSVQWEYYPGTGGSGAWTIGGGSDASTSSGFTRKISNITIEATAGYENQVRIRLRAVDIRSFGITNPEIIIYSVDVKTFDSEISDTASSGAPYPIYTNLTTPVVVNLSVTRAGSSTLCGLDNTANNYDVFYRRDNSDVQGGTELNPTTNNFVDDLATFSYSIPQITTNYTLYYAIRIRDVNGYFYWSSTFRIEVYDGTAPNNGTITYNPLLENLDYNEDLIITVPVTDTGGSGLMRADCYWRVGNQVVSNQIGFYDDFDTAVVSGSSGNAIFTIPSANLSARESTYIQLYIYDNAYNLKTLTTPLKITPRDTVAPVVNHISNTSTNNQIEYDAVFTITYSFFEDARASGFDDQTQSIRLCWNNESSPTHANEYTGSRTVTPTDAFSFQLPFLLNIYSEFSLDDNVYFWINTADINNNQRTTYSTPNHFTIVDTKAPTIIPLGSALDDLSYDTSRTVQIRVTEAIGAAGLDWGSIRFYYSVNVDNFNAAILLPNSTWQVYTSGTERGLTLTYQLNSNWYNYEQIVYLYMNATDKRNNSPLPGALKIGQITIIDGVKPYFAIYNVYPATNLTQIRTLYDLQITVNTYDIAGGSGFYRVSMAYKIGTSPFTWASASFYLHGTSLGSNLYRFNIPKTNLTVGAFYYIFRSYDNDNNFVEYSNNIAVIEQTSNPKFISYNIGDDPDQYLNKGNFKFTFDLSSNCLMFLSLDGVMLNPLGVPYMGTRLEYDFDIKVEGEYIISVAYYIYSWSYAFYLDFTAPNKINAASAKYTASARQVSLSWDAPEGSETEHKLIYLVYRGSSPNFDAKVATESFFVGNTEEKAIVDDSVSSGKYYYKIIVKDAAGNVSEPSDAIEVEVPLSTIVYAGAVAGIVGAIGAVVIIKKKKTVEKQTLSERGVKRIVQKEKVGTRDDFWETPSDSPIQKASNEPQWQDISHQAYSASSSPRAYQAGSFGAAASGTIASGSMPVNDPTAKMNPEMRELYKNAEEFVEMGQESMAAKSYEMILRMAEKQNDQRLIDLIKSKLEGLYQ